jgi:hypothetical protein
LAVQRAFQNPWDHVIKFDIARLIRYLLLTGLPGRICRQTTSRRARKEVTPSGINEAWNCEVKRLPDGTFPMTSDPAHYVNNSGNQMDDPTNL